VGMNLNGRKAPGSQQSSRTSLQDLADALDSEVYRTLRGVESAVKLYPDVSGQFEIVVAALKCARTPLRQLMHEDDVRSTP